MNAFKNEESAFMKESGGAHRGQMASPGDWGWIEISRITVDGAAVLLDTLEYPGPDETVVHVPLAQSASPDQTVNVEIDFQVQLPALFARTGHRGQFHMIGQWFPKIGVLEGPPGAEKWVADTFHANSEFYADFGTYDVTLRVPRDLVVDATGVLVAAKVESNLNVMTYRAEDVHDFAWFAGPSLSRLESRVPTGDGDVSLVLYFPEAQRGFAARHAHAAGYALQWYSEHLVPYPWSRMVVLSPPSDAQGAAGGMEYPALVTTSANGWYSPEGIHLPESVTIHEIGHNWFQGLLASNEGSQAWLDEGVNQYTEALILEEMFGKTTSLADWANISASTMEMGQALLLPVRNSPDPIDQRPEAFHSPPSYFAASYGRTATTLRTLENQVGSERLLTALKAYATKHAFKHPTGTDFFHSLNETLGDLPPWLKPAFLQRGHVAFRVLNAHCDPQRTPGGVFGRGEERRATPRGPAKEAFSCEVVVANTGTISVPTEVEVIFGDRSRKRFSWDGRVGWHRIRLDRTSPIATVQIDPDRAVLINDTRLVSGLALGAASDAPRRLGNRLQFWSETAMQLVGL